MNLNCSNQESCPVILDSKCVFYEGENLLFIGVNTNDNYRYALQQINAKMADLILSGGITELRGDVLAIGPGEVTATLATVNGTPGQYGSSTAIPKLTVDGKGRVTAITTEAVFIPSGALSFVGDVTGTGNTGTNTTLTLATVNSNIYTTNTFLKFRVNAKGLVTSATPVVSGDITGTLGYTPYNSTNPSGFISGITSPMVITALGYTPYNNTNPAGFISGITGTMVTNALGYTPYNSTNPDAFIPLTALSANSPLSYNNTTGVFTIQPANASQNGYLSSTDWSTFNTKQPALSGTGFVKISGTTISYDNTTYYPASNPSSFISGITSLMVTNALGFNPYNSSNPAGYISGINSLDVTTALGFTPYNSTNPSNFISRLGLTASAPLFYNNTNGDFTIQQANATHDGYLSSDDWTTFNNKQPSGSYITDLTGEASGTGPGSASVILNNGAVTGKILTGVNVTGGNITDTDSILIAFGKLQNQINSLIGSSIYKGVWNAATNTPTLTSGVGIRGWYYIVDVYGTTTLDGISEWHVGDWAIFNGTAWQKVDTTDAVISVNGQIGAVSLTTDNIPEGVTNRYFTTVRARTSLSAGTGLSYNDNTGVFSSTITQYTDALARTALSAGSGIGYDNTTGTISNTAPDRTVTIGSGDGISVTGTYPNFTITSIITQYTDALARAAISGGTGISYNSTTGVITNTITQYTDALARAAISGGTGISYNSTTGVITNTITQYTDALARASISAGTGISYSSSTGVISSTITQYTNALARQAISLTTTGTSGAATYDNITGVLNIPQYQGGVTSFNTRTGAITLTSGDVTGALTYTPVTNARTLTINGTTYDLSADRSWTIISGITGSGTTNYIPKWTSTSGLGNSNIQDSGTVITLGVLTNYTYSDNNFAGFNIRNTNTNSFALSGIAIQNSGGTTVAQINYVSTVYANATLQNTFLINTVAAQKLAFATNSGGGGTRADIYFTVNPAFALSGSNPNQIQILGTSRNVIINYAGTDGGQSFQVNGTAAFSSSITGNSFVKSGGTSTQFLKADGSIDSSTYITSAALSGYVPTSRTLTINGVTYDLTADRSWTVSPSVNATNTQDYTATAGQTVFTVTGGYTVGQLAVYYNGSKLSSAEFTATNGTSFTLTTAAQLNDILQAVVSVTGGGIGGSGTTNYVPKFTASGVLGDSAITDNGTTVSLVSRALSGTSAVFSSSVAVGGAATTSRGLSIKNSNDATSSGITFQNLASPFNEQGYINYNQNVDVFSIINTSAFASGGIVLGTNNTERLRILTNGNVGIGTDTPAKHGNVGFTTLTVQSAGTNRGWIEVGTQTASSNGNIFGQISGFNGTNVRAGEIRFFDGGAVNKAGIDFAVLNSGSIDTVMRLSPVGNLSLGTLADNGQRLQVNGSINMYNYTSFTTSTKTASSGGTATFVMATDYGMNVGGDNIGGLVVINISEASTAINVGNAAYVGIVINPRGSGGSINQITRALGGGITSLSVSMSGNNIAVNASTSSGGSYRASLTFIGGGGTS